jgi:hypothetical protein
VISENLNQSRFAQFGQNVALAGLLIYVAFAPHSVAASSIGVALATIGWLCRIVATRRLGLSRSKFDVIILLSLIWTALSAVLSAEPQISIAKLQASWCVLLFYLTRAVVTKTTALALSAVLILSGCVGVAYSAIDLLRGRGVVVDEVAVTSPLRKIDIQPGDTVWRIGRTHVYSVSEVDGAIMGARTDQPLSVSVISRGEHVERILKPGWGTSQSTSGITGNRVSHQFRASGWTRHYETFAEVIQIIAQLSLGLALAHFGNHGANKYFKIALPATVLLILGIAFTAMRTVLVAFAIGASVVAWRTLRGVPKVVFTAVLSIVLGFGAVVVWQTRADKALVFGDDSSSLRAQVARVGLSRILVHPVFGHGMDAMKLHWTEWGFPGNDMLHLHSTPLQLAFDRGLPMLVLWLWMMIAFWIHLARSTKAASELSDTNVYGILLGTLGALTGFLASSLVNYNYGDSEVAMLFWYSMGVATAISDQVVNRKS